MSKKMTFSASDSEAGSSEPVFSNNDDDDRVDDGWATESAEFADEVTYARPTTVTSKPSKLEHLLEEHDEKRDALYDEFQEVKYATYFTSEEEREEVMDQISVEMARMDRIRKSIIRSPLSYIVQGARPLPIITLSSPSAASCIALPPKRDPTPFYDAVGQDLQDQQDAIRLPTLVEARDAADATLAAAETELTPVIARLKHAISKPGIVGRLQAIVDHAVAEFNTAKVFITKNVGESSRQFDLRKQQRQARMDATALAQEHAIAARNAAQRSSHPRDEHVPQFKAELIEAERTLASATLRASDCRAAVYDAEVEFAFLDRQLKTCFSLITKSSSDKVWTRPVHKVLFRVKNPSILADFPEFSDQIELIGTATECSCMSSNSSSSSATECSCMTSSTSNSSSRGGAGGPSSLRVSNSSADFPTLAESLKNSRK